MIKDRVEAGQLLGDKLIKCNLESPTVLAIPRGGIIVGHEIAKKLGCKLDVVISKKITPAENPEYAIGAITHDGTLYKGNYWNNYSSDESFADELTRKKQEVKRRLEEYRRTTEYDLERKTIVLVDDGIATGSTAFAILNWLSKQRMKKVLLAIPVIPADTYEAINDKVSDVVTLQIPTSFSSVGQFYSSFEQVSDDEVKKILVQYD
ncbi:MAG: Phosphoribosyltransferase [Nitrosopumilales archaeon]|nr:MAG: Phosphoribosyltransferase [Nitrosopumilales archaeon]